MRTSKVNITHTTLESQRTSAMFSGPFLQIVALFTVSVTFAQESAEDVQQLLVDWKLVNSQRTNSMSASDFLTYDVRIHRTMLSRKRLLDKSTMETFCP